MKFEHESAQGEYGSNLGEAVGGASDDEAVEEARCGQVRPEGAEVVLMARYEETHVEIAGKARCAAIAFCLVFATS